MTSNIIHPALSLFTDPSQSWDSTGLLNKMYSERIADNTIIFKLMNSKNTPPIYFLDGVEE